MALIKAEFMSQMVFLLQRTFHITCTKNKICFCFLFETDGCLLVGRAPGSGRSSVFTASPLHPLHVAVLFSHGKPSLHAVCAKQKSPHTHSPKFRLFPFQLRIYTRAWLCVQTHTLLCETCPRSRAAVLAPWWCSQQWLTELISRQPLSSALSLRLPSATEQNTKRIF